MSCDASSCQSSNCHRNGDATRPRHALPPVDDLAALCLKCKSARPFSSSSSAVGGGREDDARFCADCFRSNLFGKFRHSVISNAMISPADNVLVAFSGGPASRVALQFVHEMQYKVQRDFDASRDRSLRVFGVGVAFIDESSAYSVPMEEANKVREDIRWIVSSLSPPEKELHIFPLEEIYSNGLNNGKEKLMELLDMAGDATGKEDLLVHLRVLSLQKIATDNGYTRVVLGSCTSKIACHVITATVKGQGYSLPADIQYADARWDVPVVLPLRDCLEQEIDTLCHLESLKTTDLPHKESLSTINTLVSSFVALLQKENPSRESTIVRTAGKLTPFHFNRIPELKDDNVPLATRRRQKRSSLKLNGSLSSESFCPICYGPVNPTAHSLSVENTDQPRCNIFVDSCCLSCRFQILPQDPSQMEHFMELWPQTFVTGPKQQARSLHLSSLREQIQDCLLSDSDNES
ncbi:hypothetical protein MLD38_028800 [Melastoma candidum]|uniref:Uncharacterized protein n=1 Tax=Melastoma candidum TaxID=119954 RepID=A0ACB9N7U3_9MYRT|nr:hypothetical protein MLD38_028800 [Melastoma candidum]